jgi:transcription elongation GreA/GreB family factor
LESTIKQDAYKILRYFNLYKSGIYILTDEKPLDADYIIPIKSNQRNGFLLQCYDSGHINKVFVSVLLSRRIGKEYMNGLNLNDHLNYITIIDSEKIIGIYFNENGKRKFKAHLTENISCRELLHLQGYKVIYNDFSRLEYKILPLELNTDINRLVFQSFNANGKPVDNSYYDHEWNILNQFSKKEKIANNKVESNSFIEQKEQKEQKEHEEHKEQQEQKENKVPITQTLFDNLITHHSTVRLKYLNKDKEFIVHLVDYETKEFETSAGIQKIYNKSPLAVSIIGKTVGESVKIGNTDYYVEIMKIL